VLAEKKASQLALIADSAAEDEPAEDEPAEDEPAGDELDEGVEEPLLPQPASTKPTAAAMAGTREIRRIRGWNRMSASPSWP
jgi:hypothetical protein